MSNQPTSNDTLRLVLIVLAIIVLAPMLMMVLVFPMMGMWGGGMMGGYGGMGGFGVSPIWGIAMSLVWLVVLVGGGYLVYRWATGTGSAGTDPALEELRLAYARGDVTEEEYEARRSRLGGE